MLTVIAYDVTDDRRRARISNFLEDYGVRVNYSVFECELARNEFERLQEQLLELIDSHQDRIVFYRLCERCRGRREALGKTSPASENTGTVIIA